MAANKKNTWNPVGTVRYLADGTKRTTVNFDGDEDYRAGMAEALKKFQELGSARDAAKAKPEDTA